MKYFFILGNNPTLSFAEIVAVLNLKPEQILMLTGEAAIAEMEEEIKEVKEKLMRRLGGTIKIGIIVFQSLMVNFQSIFNEKIFNNVNSGGKYSFGISYYGKGGLKNEKQLAMEIKKALKEKGVSSRWVTSREKQLSSVVVEQNKLVTDKGTEIVIIGAGKTYYIGRTLAVQPFKELSARDYGRPGRDDYSGMLPPKLAQMMINLATSPHSLRSSPLSLARKGAGGEVLLDPFCGSGTIITEAALMGFQDLIGCDKSEKAISDTRKNFQFTISNFFRPRPAQWGRNSIFNSKISNNQLKLFKCDVRNLNNKIKPDSVDVIVTEPYLGPSRARRDRESIKEIVSELEELYNQAISQFAKALKKNGRIVMVWPVFKARDTVLLSAKNILQNSDLKIINPLENFRDSNNIVKLTNRQTIIYGREGQKVWREIVILKK
ncbi:hypothetical protein COT99_01565 [Candidatus Falkowbacteria bacterium CG10_big_fil_rev_8_21_14_0_10_43_10]|uniref:Ribosomal RNA large subunit methyltransferase K/L-like methyltransferase domain-containing protein n=1 Tax=Candidatus Falkowbacteria bacterium CG10_big_fil_rev_8_21_14_0_10_43_10 TaxID=1974567 RepID=A0A2H0V2G5_9BACT|nr:MAG: hypothetical protein COT99_01565 [Candidatus Falkowbacteria bacterium CG10_big_fil_rev_8_21_14_0_10_43_10]